MMQKQKNKGFTIIELLIVIVVIGVLATVILLNFNNITGYAQTTVVRSDLTASAKQINLERENLGGQIYPADLASVNKGSGLQNSSGVKYQYSVNNSSNPASYCLTATKGTVSYFINTASSASPTLGACPGHGVGGIDPSTNVVTNPSATYTSGSSVVIATNLAINPSFESDLSNQSIIGSTSPSVSLDSSTAYAGTNSLKMTAVADGTLGRKFLIGSGAYPVGTIFSWSLAVKSSISTNVSPYWEVSSPYAGGSNGSVFLTANTWTVISGTMTVTSATATGYGFGLFSSSVPSGTYMNIDAGLVRQSDASNLGSFFDGASSPTTDYQYAWTGTTNNSTSSRKALSLAGWNINQQTAGAIVYQVTMPSGAKGARVLFPAGIAASSWRVLQVDLASQSLLQSGAQSTFIIRWRKSSTISNTGYTMSVQQGNGTGGYFGPSTAVSTTMNEVSNTVTNSATPSNSTVLYIGINTDASFNERWIDIEHAGVYNSAYGGGYKDGTSTNWIWNGTPNASTSTGP